MKKVTLKPNKDIGDCEFIHTAINGQSSTNLEKKRRVVDCYTMDSAKEIKRRLILCLFYYKVLEETPIQYKFSTKYCGKVYIMNHNGEEEETINVEDYLPKIIMNKIKGKDLEHTMPFK